MEGIVDTMRDDLARIRRDAEAAQTCLVDLPESPGTVASLRKQVDDLSEELLKTQQQLNLKTNGMYSMSHLLGFDHDKYSVFSSSVFSFCLQKWPK